MYELIRQEDGHTVIFRTDNELDFIRKNIEDCIKEYDLASKVSAVVDDVGDGWTRVEVQFSPDLNVDLWRDIGTDFECAFSKHGKQWYDCRDQGQNPDGTVMWWIVKHNHGPWI